MAEEIPINIYHDGSLDNRLIVSTPKQNLQQIQLLVQTNQEEEARIVNPEMDDQFEWISNTKNYEIRINYLPPNGFLWIYLQHGSSTSSKVKVYQYSKFVRWHQITLWASNVNCHWYISNVCYNYLAGHPSLNNTFYTNSFNILIEINILVRYIYVIYKWSRYICVFIQVLKNVFS